MHIEVKTVKHKHGVQTYHVVKDGRFVEAYDYKCNALARKREELKKVQKPNVN